MGRPQARSDDEILAAARAVFLEKGIAATTADVAARCGVGEATVFRRFPTKHELFRAAMTVELHPPFLDSLGDLVGRGDVHKTLCVLGHEIAAYARRLMPVIMMTLANPAVSEFERRKSVRVKVLAALTGFFAEEIRLGRVTVGDPQVAAHIFVGGIVNMVLTEMLQPGGSGMTEASLLEGLADALCGRRS